MPEYFTFSEEELKAFLRKNLKITCTKSEFSLTRQVVTVTLKVCGEEVSSASFNLEL